MRQVDRITWQLLRHAPPTTVEEPWGIFRLLDVRQRDGNTEIVTDDYIEDPAVDRFFVVLKDLGKSEWLCYYEGQYVYCLRMSMGFKGHSYLDAGYFYAPYIPLT